MGFWQFLSRRRYSFDGTRPVVDLAKIRDSKEFNNSMIDAEESSEESSTAPPPARRRRTGLDISRAYVDPQSEWQDRAVGLGTTISAQLTSVAQLEGVIQVKQMKWSKWIRGSYGLNNQCVLVKQYGSDTMSSFEAQCMNREIKLLQSLKRCEGIIDIQKVLGEESGTRLVFDGRVQFLDLLLNTRSIPLSMRDIAVGIVKPVLVGLGYLHSAGIIVRNLREATILLSSQGAMIGNLFLHADKFHNLPFDRVGQLEYMAPEVLNKPMSHEVFQMVMDYGIGENDLPQYNESVDIWSLGVMVYKLLTGKLPFNGDTPEEIAEDQRQKLKRGRRLPMPSFLNDLEVPHLAKFFVWECLQIAPENRKTVDQLLEHPWIQSQLQGTSGYGKDFPTFKNLIDSSLGTTATMLSPRTTLLCSVREQF
eukprot:TRINITY_DN3995_c2_g2_i1.p1 TRINITY_DN3995_c2_g2~~TRINITY_DN3995_c2_g2_i1.p1  ORF type:complete len:421 (-),score=79.05 TRINITY_DN3995_c2_g2_i1:992-2254(-)